MTDMFASNHVLFIKCDKIILLVQI